MKILLDESQCKRNLRPFTLTRHTSDIRIGILTIREKWEALTGEDVPYVPFEQTDDTIVIPANIIPAQGTFKKIIKLAKEKKLTEETGEWKTIQFPWHIFQLNDWATREDFTILTGKKRSKAISKTNQLINKKDIFIEKGANVEYCILNASTGPIYIGKDATIMEGSMIRGPFSLGEKGIVKMGSKIYGATTIGPHCMAGGEIKNSILFESSNKAHDGYLGDSVIGSWCNLGAGTTNSNLKNTAGDVKYFLDDSSAGISAGNKAGLLMGDYSRSAINTSFNTGTVVGVCCNIFGADLSKKYFADFTWGRERYDLEKAIRDVANWKRMKHKDISARETELLTDLYNNNK